MASIEEYAEHLSVKSNLGRIISDESILMIACNKEVRECLRQLDILVDDRELDLKKQLVDLYKYFTERTRQCQQKDLTIKEKVKKVKVLESHVRRISTEKMETDEIYERNLFGFNSKVATLQNELDRLTKEKEHEEGKNVISVSNLRSNVQSLYNQINWLVSEKEKIDEMNVTQMSELHSQIATIQLKIELAVSEEQQAAERFKTQVSLFKTKFRQLNAMYEQLRYIFKQELHQTNEAVLNADTRMAERKRQIQDLSEKLEFSYETTDRIRTKLLKEVSTLDDLFN
ncbi:uncharacterized protein LOC106878640 [Octopus bimaculoides]|uniref:uncharacterized protein LOC106878640 n=1 Tax=Octopus bimaculoides TaxID=37653 RepID=UPI00071DAF4B|nr:uncharacterized protein LOC106878640 [Octopus bimaculoides]|eukprot:XP_014783407.1 PREDICTED: intracellular protein transport protein USO1-like [Octopus bimaculoides]